MYNTQGLKKKERAPLTSYKTKRNKNKIGNNRLHSRKFRA